MLVVLADDFSGAAEIGGIAWRYGLKAEIQLKFTDDTDADIIIIDTDSRGLSMTDAIQKIEQIVSDLKKGSHTIQFKKVDSVFRGHIVAEINVLQKRFNYDKVFLLPANPNRGRKIIAGNYFVNGTSLEKTVFATDPVFPSTSSSITEIIGSDSKLSHIHIKSNDTLPASALITGDVTSKKDIRNYIKHLGDNDLCCGAAECFEAYLENKGYVVDQNISITETGLIWPSFSLIINGSTVKDQFENDVNSKIKLQTLPLPGAWEGNKFILEKEKEHTWQRAILSALHLYKIVATSIDHEVKQLSEASAIFSTYFVRLVDCVLKEFSGERIHFALTGGATASAIMKGQGIGSLIVKKEIAPGIVTLIDKRSKGLFTVKPGSYLWPASFIKSLNNKIKSGE